MDPELLKIVKCWNLWQIRGSQVIFKGNLTAKNQQQREPIWSWMELNAERSVILHSCYGLLIPLSLLLTIFKAWLIANVWTYIKRIFQFKCRYSPCVRPYFSGTRFLRHHAGCHRRLLLRGLQGQEAGERREDHGRQERGRGRQGGGGPRDVTRANVASIREPSHIHPSLSVLLCHWIFYRYKQVFCYQ